MKNRKQTPIRIALCVFVFFATAVPGSGALGGVTERVSVDSGGNPGNLASETPAISADGRFTAFCSDATNLVADDTNSVRDVFVHDRQTGVTERVSVDSAGNEVDDHSCGSRAIFDPFDGPVSPATSADGRFVAFVSNATNLVAGDTNGVRDVFVHDRWTRATTRVSIDSAGSEANDPSGTNSSGGRSNQRPAISADGRLVAFLSHGSTLAPGDTNGQPDVFVHDRQTGTTTLVSVDSAGNQSNGLSDYPSISSDGRFVAFVCTFPSMGGGVCTRPADRTN